jgi:hypothetical protein
METQADVLVGLLTDILGKPRKRYDSIGQLSFDCPICSQEKGLDGGDGKGNLEVSYAKHLYKCWACSDTHGTHGPLGKLFDIFGTKKQKRIYNLLKPEEFTETKTKKSFIRLPEGYTTFEDSNPIFIPHREAYNYLKSRGITDEMIKKHKIGYTVKGDFAYRVIIPSFNSENKLNYFVARSWVKKKIKYKNPNIPKEDIIFNENLIDWKKDIYICEGVFDSLFFDNSLVLLGKKMNKFIFENLYDKSEGLIHIVLDGDAWEDALNLYHELNGGRLYNKIRIYKLPKTKDACDLRGDIENFLYEIV